ncbi:C-terminal binding protein [Paenibacillus hemerocallicola]|uniref:C-terminal binding protein n=1 Tax=Paenibacillus hemerocallicola TaxID=1172614 RepID=A0A5C4TC72_9BACL|nr:C-terminal binding protein [Paenibacillus hemerocallicola]TNJ66077.1 C-terminal binding protein [Paenibacillus hemerocallicola]
MAKYKVLMADCIFEDHDFEKRMLETIDAELIVAPAKDEDTLAALAVDADAILATYAEITSKVLEHAKKCKIIARTGIGYNNIDVHAASEKGIMVSNVPDYCIGEVADHTLALMLTCLRKTAYLNQTVREGKWNVNLARPIPRLDGLTVGLMGLGNIARAVVQRIQAFGMKAIAFDPFVSSYDVSLLAVEKAESLEQLAQRADVLTIHAPLTPSSKGAINSGIFNVMKKSAILINTSRGPIVNEKDLYEAIRVGKIAGCGLDVMEHEGEEVNSPLLKHENVIVTPHSAFYSSGSDIELREKAVEQIVLTFTSGHPSYWINRPSPTD